MHAYKTYGLKMTSKLYDLNDKSIQFTLNKC